jgi:LysM repeat protein
MNNPNPFVPQGSLLERQSQRRSHFKWGVLLVLTVGVIGLSAMLFQGCKREEQNPPESDNNPPPMQTNDVSSTDTNVPSNDMSNAPADAAAPAGAPGAPVANMAPAAPVSPPFVVPPAPAATESEYVVVKGDTLGKIAKANGVTLRALESANPDVKPTQLHLGEKLVIPAGASTTGATAAGETANGLAANGDEVYVVKAGDSLTRIAHHFGVTVKAIEAENNLTTTRINVGKKLQIPAKAAPESTPVNAPPQSTTAPETVPTTPSNPPAQAAPAPAQSGQQ